MRTWKQYLALQDHYQAIGDVKIDLYGQEGLKEIDELFEKYKGKFEFPEESGGTYTFGDMKISYSIEVQVGMLRFSIHRDLLERDRDPNAYKLGPIINLGQLMHDRSLMSAKDRASMDTYLRECRDKIATMKNESLSRARAMAGSQATIEWILVGD